ncbi:hypothetical protein RP20_CCG021503 [Aedes albopictus]|nr:hypothetical protein RP20_CCG021503 [Aedes albopictus]
MACCIFKNCFNRPTPFSKVTFFNIPKDSRRQLWLERSGNEQVRNLPLSARRLVCEAHFDECHIRRQFHRTTLSRDAVPVSYENVFKYVDDRVDGGGQMEEQDGDGAYIETAEIDLQEVPSGAGTELVEEYLGENETDVYQVEYMEEIEEPQEVQQTRELLSPPKAVFGTVATQTDDFPKTLPQPSPPCKKRKLSESLKETTDQATNTEPTVVEPERAPTPPVVSTAEQSTQTDTPQKPPENPVQKTEEEYFLLSLAEPLQRLPPEKRAMAKVKMLTYLVQLGCGMENVQL